MCFDNLLTFGTSTRPHTAADIDSRVNSPARTLQSPLSTRPLLSTREGIDGVDVGVSSATELIYHSSDFCITPIVDNPKVLLSFPINSNSIVSFSARSLFSFLDIYQNLLRKVKASVVSHIYFHVFFRV